MSSRYIPEYLQNEASKAINEAVAYEKKGEIEKAIEKYQQAINYLTKLVDLDPNNKLVSVYLEYIAKCQAKINTLKSSSKEKISESLGDVSELIYKAPEVKFEDVIGLEYVKQKIIEAIIYPSKRRDLFPLGWPRNILLFGPPGCGKTLLCVAIANEVNGVMLYLDPSLIFSKWLGESEKNVAKVLNFARKLDEEGKTVIIFIDEADSIFGIRYYEVGGETRVRNQLLAELDGLKDKNTLRKIYIIASTNKPWLFDHAFLRRFQLRLYIPPPDFRARVELFKYYSKSLKPDSSVDFNKLAELTHNYSASDIRDVCIDVQNKLAREVFEYKSGIGNIRNPTMEDFVQAIKNRKPSINEEIIKKYEEWYEKYKS